MIEKQPTTLDRVFSDRIKKSVESLGPAPSVSEEESTTQEKQIPQDEVHSEPKVIEPKAEQPDNSVAEEKEVAPVIEAQNKSDNENAKESKEIVTGEKEIKEFQFDEADKTYLSELFGDNKEGEKNTEKHTKDTKGKKEEAIDYEEKYKPYVEKATEYDSFLSDPLTKAFLEFRKSGGNDPNEFIKQTGIIDVEKLTPEQLVEMDMKNNGLNQDEIAEELDKFKELSTYEKKKLTKSVKDEILKSQDEKLKAFAGQNEKSQLVMKEAVKRGTAELDSVVQGIQGKKYKGLLITPQMANDIRNYVMKDSVPKFDEKGQFVGFDIQESVRRAVILHYDDIRSKALIDLGKVIGADNALSARIRPNKKEVVAAVVPTQQKSFDDVKKETSDKMWKQRGVIKK